MIEVRQAGLLTSVQDLGRNGYGVLGVSRSGAADPVALRLGNRLLGNPPGAAALEMTLLGGTFVFHADTAIALSGADFGATLDGAPLVPWLARSVRAGQSLRVGATRAGARCYLCVRGGVDVPLVLGSASTHLLSGTGGFQGRTLRAGDWLKCHPADPVGPPRRLDPRLARRLTPRRTLRVTWGLQRDWFPASTQRAFLAGTYRATEECNRMGLRLSGPELTPVAKRELLTEGVPLGAVQIPPGGQPIILFVELQTTGGYPKIANVITADLASIGQIRPRDDIRFEFVEPDRARAHLREQERLLESDELFVPAPTN
jgi:5-oxoprolinase (ATP-hydrolysing) subunit C